MSVKGLEPAQASRSVSMSGRRTRAWLYWILVSVLVGYAVAYGLALAFPNAVVEVAMLAFGWGVCWISVTPAVLRAIGRRWD